MAPISMLSVTGPAPCLARSRPNLMIFSRSSSDALKVPSFRCSISSSGALGATRRFSDVFHIVNVKIDQIAEGLGTPRPSSDRRVSTINLVFGFRGPFPRMIMAEKRLCDIAAFAPDLDLPGARADNLVNVAICVYSACTNPAHSGVETWRIAVEFSDTKECARRRLSLWNDIGIMQQKSIAYLRRCAYDGLDRQSLPGAAPLPDQARAALYRDGDGGCGAAWRPGAAAGL